MNASETPDLETLRSSEFWAQPPEQLQAALVPLEQQIGPITGPDDPILWECDALEPPEEPDMRQAVPYLEAGLTLRPLDDGNVEVLLPGHEGEWLVVVVEGGPRGADALGRLSVDANLDPAHYPMEVVPGGGKRIWMRKPTGLRIPITLGEYQGVRFHVSGSMPGAGSLTDDRRLRYWCPFPLVGEGERPEGARILVCGDKELWELPAPKLPKAQLAPPYLLELLEKHAARAKQRWLDVPLDLLDPQNETGTASNCARLGHWAKSQIELQTQLGQVLGELYESVPEQTEAFPTASFVLLGEVMNELASALGQNQPEKMRVFLYERLKLPTPLNLKGYGKPVRGEVLDATYLQVLWERLEGGNETLYRELLARQDREAFDRYFRSALINEAQRALRNRALEDQGRRRPKKDTPRPPTLVSMSGFENLDVLAFTTSNPENEWIAIEVAETKLLQDLIESFGSEEAPEEATRAVIVQFLEKGSEDERQYLQLRFAGVSSADALREMGHVDADGKPKHNLEISLRNKVRRRVKQSQ